MSDETKLACGCYAEWTGERWQVAASSFLCDHNQGDPVDGAVPLPGQPDLLNVAKHHAPGVVHQYLVETVAALAAAEAEVARLREVIVAKDDLLVAYRTGDHRKAGKAIDKLAALAREDAS